MRRLNHSDNHPGDRRGPTHTRSRIHTQQWRTLSLWMGPASVLVQMPVQEQEQRPEQGQAQMQAQGQGQASLLEQGQ